MSSIGIPKSEIFKVDELAELLSILKNKKRELEKTHNQPKYTQKTIELSYLGKKDENDY
jgi:hypothetical protein